MHKPWNVDKEGVAKTVLAGYFKYGAQTLLTGNFGTSGTVVLEVYEDGEGDEYGGGRDCADGEGSVLQDEYGEFLADGHLGSDGSDRDL